MSFFVLKVAVPAPLEGLFEYLPPLDQKANDIQPGARVMVPFGNTVRCGVVVETAAYPSIAKNKLKRVKQVLDTEPLLTEEQLKFQIWAANYYRHPVGEVVFAALPNRLRKGKQMLPKGEPGWRLTDVGKKIARDDLSRAPKQQAILAYVQKQGRAVGKAELLSAFQKPAGSIKALVEKELLEICQIESAESNEGLNGDSPQLNKEQREVIEEVGSALGDFSAFLLHGVTGSGKTEVYIRLAIKALQDGTNVLVLVPEIALTPQLHRRFQSRIAARVLLMHSGLSETAQERVWQKVRGEKPYVLIGTRSAIFSPLQGLGLLIVDEEHDTSFKQQEGFRYSARDLAVVRAKRSHCPILLGSATPSLESLHNAQEDKYRHLCLRQRATGAQLPDLDLIDINGQKLEAGLSKYLLGKIQTTLDSGQQVLLFLNRRGYAPVVTCYECEWLSDCPRCDAKQTLHAASARLCCHHCGAQRRLPTHCPSCKSQELHPLGVGTEQLEQSLQRRFPDYPLIRIDRDATRRKGSLNAFLKKIMQGEPSILIGTQMLAKGHHFPDVTLVGLVEVDSGLYGADFRATERLAQLVIQVAGRAGRGAHPGQVLVQTRFPDHPLLQTLAKGDYSAFANRAIVERMEAELPPYTYQVLLRAQANKVDYPTRFLHLAVQMASKIPSEGISLWGPVAAPMQRLAGKYRAHLLIQSASRPAVQRFLDHFSPGLSRLPLASRVRWSLDIDPQDLY